MNLVVFSSFVIIIIIENAMQLYDLYGNLV